MGLASLLLRFTNGFSMRSVSVALNNNQYPHSLVRMLQSVWLHRQLIIRLTLREVASRYQGSLLGVLWTVLQPLLLLAMYTFVFSVVFSARWGTPVEGDAGATPPFALILFSGLLLIGVFNESLTRAPTLLIDNLAYVKKVVFPLEILPWVITLSAFINAGIGALLLISLYVFWVGVPSVSILVIPILLIPLFLLSLTSVYLLSSTGVFVRDLRQVVGLIAALFLFLTPIFYPLEAVPEQYRPYLLLNPLTILVDQVRLALFWSKIPTIESFLLMLGIGVVLLSGSYWWFMKLRKGFADVL